MSRTTSRVGGVDAGGAARAEWVTQVQAAEIAGCAVSTIDWHSRQPGTVLRTRPRVGQRPTIQRASVEEFGRWWAHQVEARAAKRRQREERAARLAARRAVAAARGVQGGARTADGSTGADVPADAPATGLTTTEAAVALGVETGRVVQMIHAGDLAATMHRKRWWVEEASLQAVVDERSRWATVREAAELVGCTTTRIRQAVEAGDLTRRPGVSTAAASYSRDGLEQLRIVVQAEQSEQAAQRARLTEQRAASAAARRPPDSEHQWLRPRDVAGMLGCSTSWVHVLIADERLPATPDGTGRAWIRLDHIAQRLSAQQFAVRQRRASRRIGMDRS